MTVYVESLQRHVGGATLEKIRLASPFVLRSVTPPLSSVSGKRVRDIRRLGKRIVLALEDGLFVVIHLMIAGRLRWLEPGGKIPGKIGLAALDFSTGSLIFTEASTKKRASLHVVEGEAAVAEMNRGGLEVLDAGESEFRAALVRENHTLKRTLTDPRLFSGIGNAYSDEILHAAQLSPMKLSTQLTDEEVTRLYQATRQTLIDWTELLRREVAASKDGFPEKVTAFRDTMAVHGKYGQPCPRCGGRVARIVYAENEANYCPRCQTGGRMLADRALSRLLKDDWPKTADELELKLGPPSAGKPKAPPKKRKVRTD